LLFGGARLLRFVGAKLSPDLSFVGPRALTAANNLIIDVFACASTSPPTAAGVNIAHQIAAKVPTT
jgi:hypothetical protein